MPTPRLYLAKDTGTLAGSGGGRTTPPAGDTKHWAAGLLAKYGPYAAGYAAGRSGSVTEADAVAKGGDYLIGYHAGAKNFELETGSDTQPDDMTRLADLYDKLFGQTVQLPSTGQGDVTLIPTQSTSSSIAPFLLMAGGAGVIVYFVFFRKKKTEMKGGE